MNNTNDLEQVDIKRMIEIVLDRIVSIVVITVIFGLLSYALSEFFITPKYESSITMYVNNRRATADDSLETKMLSSDINASQLLVPTYIEMIKSDKVLQKVAGVVEEKTGEEYSIREIKDMLTAEAVANTEIIRVSIKTTDTAVAREIVNSIAEIAPDEIQKIIELSDVRIIDRGKISTSPVSPNVRNNTIIGALLGFVLSISFILLKEIFDVRVKSVDDLVSRFNYPVLGTVPEIFVSYDESLYEESSDD